MTIHKRIVTDENRRPVAVQIDYADWLKIERRLDMDPVAEERSEERPLSELAADAAPHWKGGDFEALLENSQGIWEEGDGLEYQRRLREEWTRPWDPEARDETTDEP